MAGIRIENFSSKNPSASLARMWHFRLEAERPLPEAAERLLTSDKASALGTPAPDR
jgi:hypothetical protein